MSEEVLEKCCLSIKFGDDFGDNECTFKCQLDNGHEGPHKEVGNVGWGKVPIPYTVTWQGSEEELAAMQELAMQELAALGQAEG